MKYFLLPLLVLLQVFLFFVDKVLFIGVLLALPVLLALIFLLHTFGGLWGSGLFGQCMVLLVFCGALACLSRLVPQPWLSPEIQQQEEPETRALLLKGLPTPHHG
jgi:hypothetical protein